MKERDQYLKQLRSKKDEFSTEFYNYKDSFSEKLEQSKEVVEWSKAGVAVLGGAFVVYKLVEWFFLQPDSEPVKESEAPTVTAPSKEHPLVAAIKSQIASFLLSIAKKELEYLLNQWRKEK